MDYRSKYLPEAGQRLENFDIRGLKVPARGGTGIPGHARDWHDQGRSILTEALHPTRALRGKPHTAATLKCSTLPCGAARSPTPPERLWAGPRLLNATPHFNAQRSAGRGISESLWGSVWGVRFRKLLAVLCV